MSNTLGRLQVDLEARIAKFESDMGRAARILQRDMVQASNASERALRQMRLSAERDMERIRSSAKSATTAVIGFFSIQQAGRLVAGLSRVADQYSNIQAKVRLAAGENANLASSLDKVFGVAQRTFNTFDGTAALVQRGSQALQSFGQSADQAFSNSLALAEIFNKALVVSGAGSQEAAAAALQFSQALASGKFSGDEFRSVMENNSRFAQLLADSLGVNIAKLREMSKAGELTTQSFVNLIGQTGTLDAQFAKMPLTIGRARAQLDNAFTKYIGEADKALGASRSIADAMSALAANVGPVLSAMGQLAIVTAGALSVRALQAVQNYGKAVLARAKAEQVAAAATAQRMQADAASNALAFTRARAEQLNAEATARSAAADSAKAKTQMALLRAQEMVIRANGLRATSEIELARLSAQLTALDAERAVAAGALGAARQREIAANLALVTSNKTLAAAQAAAGVAGAAAATKITMGMRVAQAATAAMTLASRALAGALALVGGPLGLVVIGVGLLAGKLMSASAAAKQLGVDLAGAVEEAEAFARNPTGNAVKMFDTSAAEARIKELRAALAKNDKIGGFDPFGLRPETERELRTLEVQVKHLKMAQSDGILAALQYSGGIKKTGDAAAAAAEDLTKQAERLKLERIELTQGLRARLEYEAVKSAGVKSAAELNDATRATIDTIVAESAAIDKVRESSRAATRQGKADAAEKRRLAKEQERAQRQFQDDIDRLAASMGGEYAKANSAYQLSLRDIAREYEKGGASAEQFRQQQDLLKQQFEANVAGIRASVLGPLAEATHEYQEALRLLRLDAAATGVAGTDLAASEKILARNFAETTKEIKDRLDPVGALLDQMGFEQSLLSKTNAERVVANELRRIGIGLSEEEKRVAGEAILAQQLVLEQQQRQVNALDAFRQSFEDNLVAVATGSKSIVDAFKDMADQIIAQIVRMIAQRWTEQLFGQPGSTGTGSSGGWLNSLFGLFSGSPASSTPSSFGIPLPGSGLLPGFAEGGRPPVGTPYMVGENGPEVRIDDTPGTIIPNHKLGRTAPAFVQQVSNYYAAPTEPRTQQQVAREMAYQGQRAMARNGRR